MCSCFSWYRGPDFPEVVALGAFPLTCVDGPFSWSGSELIRKPHDHPSPYRPSRSLSPARPFRFITTGMAEPPSNVPDEQAKRVFVGPDLAQRPQADPREQGIQVA